MALFYLSFCEPTRPKGQQFLGATIVEAATSLSAVRIAWRTGRNPGGEVATAELDATCRAELPEEAKKYFDRFVPREEALADEHRPLDTEGAICAACSGGMAHEH